MSKTAEIKRRLDVDAQEYKVTVTVTLTHTLLNIEVQVMDVGTTFIQEAMIQSVQDSADDLMSTAIRQFKGNRA